ncbi:hypothetical protein HK096_001381 [Nowakowskiella sp. JEL0078]|nr:hypothetical protein HK096_001381 [Nowakowskiella sp. JEL0078]
MEIVPNERNTGIQQMQQFQLEDVPLEIEADIVFQAVKSNQPTPLVNMRHSTCGNIALWSKYQPHGNTVNIQWQQNSMVLLQEPEFLVSQIQLNSPQQSHSPNRFTSVSSPSRSQFSSPNISNSPEQFVNPADLTIPTNFQFPIVQSHQMTHFPQLSQINDLQDLHEIGQLIHPNLISQSYQLQKEQFSTSATNPTILSSYVSDETFNFTKEDLSIRSRVPSHRGLRGRSQSFSITGNFIETSSGTTDPNIIALSQSNIPIPPYSRPKKHKKSQSISGLPSPLGLSNTSATDQPTEVNYFSIQSLFDPNSPALDHSGFITESQSSQGLQTGHRRVYSGQQPINYTRFSNSQLPVNSVRLDFSNQLPLSIQPQVRNPPVSNMNLLNNRINRNGAFSLPNTNSGFRLVSHSDGTMSPELISPSPILTTTSNSIASGVNSSTVSLSSIFSMNSMNSHYNTSSISLNSLNSGPGTPSEKVGMNHGIYLDENYIVGRNNELQPKLASFSSQISNFDNQHQLGIYQISSQYDNAQFQQQQAQQLIQQHMLPQNFQQLQQHEYSFPISPIIQNFDGMALQSPSISTENNRFTFHHVNLVDTQAEMQRIDMNAHLNLDTQLNGTVNRDHHVDMEDEESDEDADSDLDDETYNVTLQDDERPSEFHLCQWNDCSNSFENIDQLVNHILLSHIGQGKQNYQCHWKDCTRNLKPFGKRHKIQSHVRVHTGEKPYRCVFPDCGRYFARLDGLSTHSKTHSEVKPFNCKFQGCEKAYYHLRSLRKHLKNSHANWKDSTEYDEMVKHEE